MSDGFYDQHGRWLPAMKTTEELKHVPFEMYARVLDRAERAEAEADSLRSIIDNMRAMNIKLTMEATGQVLAAEAQCKAMRSALEAAADALDQAEMAIDPVADRRLRKYVIQAEKLVLAALDPSSAET